MLIEERTAPRMRGIMMVGTAVTRPDAVGTMYRKAPGGGWEIVAGLGRDNGVQAITPHPSEPDVVYAATRKGIYVSGDAGANWNNLRAPDGVEYWSLLINPDDPRVLLAGTSPLGVVKSDDGGRTWRTCACDPTERWTFRVRSRMMKLAFHPTNRTIVYGSSEIIGFLISEDGGESWARANDAIEGLSQRPELRNRELTQDDSEGMYDGHAVTTTPARPDSVFYIGRMGIFETDDLGKSMRDLDVGRFAPFKYSRDMRVNPVDPQTLYACFSIASRSDAGAMYRSPDLGATWMRADPQVTARSTIMGFGIHGSASGGIVSVTRHGQVFCTLDDGASWDESQLPSDAGDAFCAALL